MRLSIGLFHSCFSEGQKKFQLLVKEAGEEIHRKTLLSKKISTHLQAISGKKGF